MIFPSERCYQVAWAALGLAWAALVYHLFQLWGVSPDYSDRYVILLGSLWLVHRGRDAFAATPVRPTRWTRPLLVLALVPLPPAWYLISLMVTNSVIFWVITSSMAVATLCLAMDQWGWPRTRLLLFPVLFVLFALPIPDTFYGQIRGQLQELSTALATLGLRGMGFSVVRKGFEIYLPSGQLEVVEACSGIRSMTALTAIGAFVAHVRGFGILRGLVLLAFSVPVVCLCNGLRIVLTGFLQERVGIVYTQGLYHEFLGGFTVLLGLAIIVLFSGLLVRKGAVDPVPAMPADGNSSTNRTHGLIPSAIVLIGLLATALAGGYATSRITVREEEAPVEAVALEIGEWTGRDLPIDEEIIKSLGCTKIVSRLYTDSIGQTAQAWIMYWPATSYLRKGHHPEVCMPRRGYLAIGERGTCAIPVGTEALLTLTEQHYRRDRADQLVHSWTQDGNRPLSAQEEDTIQHRGNWEWFAKQFEAGTKEDRHPRLGVLIGMPATGNLDGTKRTLAEFSRLFAGELYRACPWAMPLSAVSAAN